ncbi:DUF3265 domain-containing protein [Vibrio parahaemolyticus]|nr:DUF3265 domain-containing protein [Vibrio parahaemolyticus]
MSLKHNKAFKRDSCRVAFLVSYADFWCMEDKGSCGVIC